MRLEHLVRFPLGLVRVVLERRDLDLSERGGFEAFWAQEATGEVLNPELYRAVVKAHLGDLYRARHSTEAGGITLNLASHQLLDDVTGWTKLNAHNAPQRDV